MTDIPDPTGTANPGAPVPTSTVSPEVVLQPMVHVQNMHRAVAFYEALGATVEHGSRDGDFVMLSLGGGQLSLLAHPANPEQDEGQVELNFETTGPLEALESKLRDAGITVVSPTSEQGFGRQLQVATPDGLLVKINELDWSRYA